MALKKNVQQKGRREVKQDNPSQSKRKSIDYTFLFLIMLVLSIGLVMLLSASAPAGASKFNDSYHFFTRQMICVVIGIVLMVVISRIDYRIYRKYAAQYFIVCAVLLVIVLIPGIGMELNGSRRWIKLPGFQLQPSEFMKLSVAILFAKLISDNKYDVSKLRDCVPFGIIMVILGVLMGFEPHLSGLIIMIGIGVWIMVASGTPVWPFAVVGVGGGTAGVAIIRIVDANRWSRLITFVNPFHDTTNAGYQISQALYAMGSGGLFGRGIGQSVQKYAYLPEPYNDFIFSVACEELGLFGGATIIILFAFLILRGFKIALNAPDKFGTLLAMGIVAQVAIQTVLNIAVTTASVPNTGVSLPFFSYGGTAILVLLAEMGILLNISRHSVSEHFN